MSEHPILFNADMVGAILQGRKTQTRRPIKDFPSYVKRTVAPQELKGEPKCHPEPYFDCYRNKRRTFDNPRGASEHWCWWDEYDRMGNGWVECPYGKPGDLLWVRETHAIVPATAYRHSREEDGLMIPHRVSPDGQDWAVFRTSWDRSEPRPWKSPAQMPRWASRIELRVKDVRVERLQSITEADAVAEGCEAGMRQDRYTDGSFARSASEWSARRAYLELWEEIYAKKFPWDSNPWVWVIEFEVIQ